MKKLVLKVNFMFLALLFAGQVMADSNNKAGDNEIDLKAEVLIDLSEIKTLPTVTLINKYGEVVAKFYGEKEKLTVQFPESFQKSSFLFKHGEQYFYLIERYTES